MSVDREIRYPGSKEPRGIVHRLYRRRGKLDEAIAASRRFSRMATVAVLVLAATAFWQGWVLSGGWPGLAGTAFGWMELATTKLLSRTFLRHDKPAHT